MCLFIPLFVGTVLGEHCHWTAFQSLLAEHTKSKQSPSNLFLRQVSHELSEIRQIPRQRIRRLEILPRCVALMSACRPGWLCVKNNNLYLKRRSNYTQLCTGRGREIASVSRGSSGCEVLVLRAVSIFRQGELSQVTLWSKSTVNRGMPIKK